MAPVETETMPTHKSSIIWTGELRGESLRLVENGSGTVAERLAGHDAMGNERWETVATRLALDEIRKILPPGLTIEKKRPAGKLPYGLVVLPKGLTFRDLTRVNEAGERALLLVFPPDFDSADNVAAIELGLDGGQGKLVLDGHYERGAFHVRAAQYYAKDEEPVVETERCPQVVAALRRHLVKGDPEESFALAGPLAGRNRQGGAPHRVTARKLLELLEAGDQRALAFVQDIHNAALRSIRQRHRNPSKKPVW